MESVTNTTRAAPLAVRAAQFVLTLQIAFELVALAFLTSAVASTFEPAPALLLLFWVAFTGTACWLMSRWRTRRPWVRWAVVALEACWAAALLLMDALDPGLTWTTALSPSLLCPLAVAALMLLPPAGRWFGETAPAPAG